MEGGEVIKIEGITPSMIWTFLAVLVALLALIVLGDKAMDVYRNAKKRKQEEKQLDSQDITDKIARKVSEKVTPQIEEKFTSFEKKFDKKFAEIDRKLASDKETLELHTSQLNAEHDRVDRLDNDTRALLHGMSALLSHSINGNSTDKLKKTQTAMSNYLIDHVYKEDAWE